MIPQQALSAVRKILPAERIYENEILRNAFSIDASVFERVAALVVDVENEEEVRALLALAQKYGVGITFRGSGTSVNGQCSGTGILARLRGPFWNRCEVLEEGAAFHGWSLVRGEQITEALAPLGRMIGPDPASFVTASFGGMVVNNAAGMCCVVEQNSYGTLQQMRAIFADGTVLDTGDANSVAAFRRSHAALLHGLAELRREVMADSEVVARIKRKYRIKNTCGYSMNAFVDFDDPLQILTHLIIGSEGTLAFVSNATLKTIPVLPKRATTLAFLPDLATAIRAVRLWQDAECAYALEFFDDHTLKAMMQLPSSAELTKDVRPGACAILLETRGADTAALEKNIASLMQATEQLEFLAPIHFSTDSETIETLWAFRRALFAACSGNKEADELVTFEDICFPLDKLEEGISAVGRLMEKYGYHTGVNGHALHGNFHFALPVRLADPKEKERLHQFIDEVMHLVVSFDGSLKAEHGTGYSVAPYVELEWGSQLYSIMKRVKALIDPAGILNPGALLNDDPHCHTRNLKQPIACDPLLDKCVDCGFCEPVCPSRKFITPRQRVHLLRTIAARHGNGDTAREQAEWQEVFDDLAIDLCATDGLCTTRCPMQVKTADYVRKTRGEMANASALRLATMAGENMKGLTRGASRMLNAVGLVQRLGGDAFMEKSAGIAKKMMPSLPVWNSAMPKGAPRPVKLTAVEGETVVYFPSCAVRTMGDSVHDPLESLTAVAVRLLKKAGYQVVYPEKMEHLCCGKAFETKGLQDEAERSIRALETALLKASHNGEFPIFCETSPCLARMKKQLDSRLNLYEPVEFATTFLLPRLQFSRKLGRIAIHPTCSTRTMGLAEPMAALAAQCAEEMVWPKEINCCGFSGDKGFNRPELNAASLAILKERIAGCEAGFSTSRTCEIGLSLHGEVPYRNLIYMLDACC